MYTVGPEGGGKTTSLSEGGLVPDQPPDASQVELASDDQVRVVGLPLGGLAVILQDGWIG